MFERAHSVDFPGELVSGEELAELEVALTSEQQAAFDAELNCIEQAERKACADRNTLIRGK